MNRSNRRAFFRELLRETAVAARELKHSPGDGSLAADNRRTQDQAEERASVLAAPTGRPVPLSELADLAQQVGLRGLEHEVQRLVRPSLRLTHSATRPAACQTHLGGVPSLPAGFEWPESKGMPLPFLGQVDLVEASAAGLAGLPDQGILLFFFDVAGSLSDLEAADRVGSRVIYLDADHADGSAPDNEDWAWFPECSLEASLELVLPHSSSIELDDLQLEPAQRSAWDELRRRLLCAHGVEEDTTTTGRRALHRLLGYPDLLRRGTEAACQPAFTPIAQGGSSANASDWRLLLQISADDDLEAHWGPEFGRLRFWAREHDLCSGNFSDTVATLCQEARPTS